MIKIVVQDELCQELSNKHNSDINICLSSLKRIMHLEKSNNLWLIPVNINIGKSYFILKVRRLKLIGVLFLFRFQQSQNN